MNFTTTKTTITIIVIAVVIIVLIMRMIVDIKFSHFHKIMVRMPDFTKRKTRFKPVPYFTE